eukprot:4215045-Amphidinium_carterae.1
MRRSESIGDGSELGHGRGDRASSAWPRARGSRRRRVRRSHEWRSEFSGRAFQWRGFKGHPGNAEAESRNRAPSRQVVAGDRRVCLEIPRLRRERPTLVDGYIRGSANSIWSIGRPSEDVGYIDVQPTCASSGRQSLHGGSKDRPMPQGHRG